MPDAKAEILAELRRIAGDVQSACQRVEDQRYHITQGYPRGEAAVTSLRATAAQFREALQHACDRLDGLAAT